jgi:hypothetical protein
MGHDHDNAEHPSTRAALAANVSHVPRVDWIHDADLESLLVGEPEPEF